MNTEIFMHELSPKNVHMTVSRFAESRNVFVMSVLDYNDEIVTVRYRLRKFRKRGKTFVTYKAEIPMDEFTSMYETRKEIERIFNLY